MGWQEIRCGQCGGSLQVPEGMFGTDVPCPHCESSVQIPYPATPSFDERVTSNPFRRRKRKELGIFSIGLGILGGILGIWLWFSLEPPPGQQRSFGPLIAQWTLSVTYVVIGILTLIFESRAIVQTTIGLLVIGYLLGLFMMFNVVSLVILIPIIWLIIRTGRQALSTRPLPALPPSDGIDSYDQITEDATPIYWIVVVTLAVAGLIGFFLVLFGIRLLTP